MVSAMDDPRERLEREAAFVRLSRAKSCPAEHTPQIGESLVQFYKGAIQRTRKFAGIAHVWETLVSPELLQHTCLESFRGGTLVILVDSSAHLYRLKQLLLQDLQKQMLALCRAQGLRKIALRPGRWYEGENETDGRVWFDESR